MSALDAASDLICTSERCDGGERQPCEDSRFVAAAVIRAYLDALDPAEVAHAAEQTDEDTWAAAVIKAIRP